MDNYSMDEFFESIDDDIYDKVYEHMELFIEGKVKNNIPAKEAKKFGNYGKDKLTPEEYDKRAKKRIGATMQGSTFSAMKNIGNSSYGSIYADPEKEAAYRGKKFKMTAKDAITHPKDVAGAAKHMWKTGQLTDQLKRATITQTSAPSVLNPTSALIPNVPLGGIGGAIINGGVKTVGGVVTDFGVSHPSGPGANRNRAKALERISRIDKERKEELEKYGKLDPEKERQRQALGRATVNRSISTKPQTKEIEKDHTIDVGKTVMNRSFSSKDFGRTIKMNDVNAKFEDPNDPRYKEAHKTGKITYNEGANKAFKKGEELLKQGFKDLKDGKLDTAAAKFAQKHIQRDIINAPKGYKAAAKYYAKTVKNLGGSAASAIRASINKKKAKTETDK